MSSLCFDCVSLLLQLVKTFNLRSVRLKELSFRQLPYNLFRGMQKGFSYFINGKTHFQKGLGETLFSNIVSCNQQISVGTSTCFKWCYFRRLLSKNIKQTNQQTKKPQSFHRKSEFLAVENGGVVTKRHIYIYSEDQKSALRKKGS